MPNKKAIHPPQYLVTYFAVVDGEHVLLVNHKNAELWPPPGAHVEPHEHPRTTVCREAREELAIEAEFILDGPLFIRRQRPSAKPLYA